MTERKPPDVSFETWVDNQIARGEARGDFENLTGSGRPLPREALSENAYDWAVAKARREGVETAAMLPPGLALRRERDELPDRAARLSAEAEVRALAEDYNARVQAFWRQPQESRWSPVPGLADVEALVSGWRLARPPEPPPPPSVDVVAERLPWWRRFRRPPAANTGLLPGQPGRGAVRDAKEVPMTEVPGTDRDEARKHVREETPLAPEDVQGVGDEARPEGDEGVSGDDAKPTPGGTDVGTT